MRATAARGLFNPQIPAVTASLSLGAQEGSGIRVTLQNSQVSSARSASAIRDRSEASACLRPQIISLSVLGAILNDSARSTCLMRRAAIAVRKFISIGSSSNRIISSQPSEIKKAPTKHRSGLIQKSSFSQCRNTKGRSATSGLETQALQVL